MFIKIVSWRLIKLLIQLQFPEIKQLSTQDLAAWLSNEQITPPLLLDARTPEEYQVSHLLNAQLVCDNLEDLNKQKIDVSTPIVVYCSVGYRSAAIARHLQAQGYGNVFNLSGSIFQWVNEYRPVYQAQTIVTQVHPYNKLWQYLLINPTN